MTKRASSFSEIFNQLNPEQKKAVECIEGPVMVIAGPGTGKTQILSARIANILQNTDTNPYNILCITYTEAGASAMRKRLTEIIGPTAYQVNIYTFHALCNTIIQDNKSFFKADEFDVISDIEKHEIMNKLLGELPHESSLKSYLEDNSNLKGNLFGFFDILEKEHFKPGDIIKKSEELLAELPNREDLKYKRKTGNKMPGDINEKKFQDEKRRISKLKAASEMFAIFKAKLLENKRYTYNDMINWVLEGFEKDPNLLLNYQEKFQYILVDEFQDTNGSQYELIEKLTSFWDNPNLFVVGDDDQSIFRFQGASMDNIKNFYNKYKNHGLQVVLLKQNYRSTQTILDTSYSFINQNTERLTNFLPNLDKKLEANSDAAIVVPTLRQFKNEAHEEAFIASEIEFLIKQGTPPQEITVLARHNKQLENLATWFIKKEIPYQLSRIRNILEEPQTKKLITILEYLNAESHKPNSGDPLLFQILHFDFFDIPAIEIAEFALANRNNYSSTWRQMMAGAKPQLSIFSEKNAVKQLFDDLEFLIKQVHNLTVPQLVEKIIARIGFLGHVLLSTEKTWELTILKTFFNHVKNEALINPSLTLDTFLLRLKLMKSNDIALAAEKTLSKENGVYLSTVHSSKGLEWDHVYMMHCQDKNWSPGPNRSAFNLDKYFNTERTTDDESDEDDDLAQIQEERRLFYVGMTRARKSLHISCFLDPDNSKNKPSVMTIELQNICNITIEETKVNQDLIFDFEMTLLSEPQNKEIVLADDQFINPVLEKYVLSPTGLNSYLSCPVSFYFNNILRVPSAKNEYACFGTAVHNALYDLFTARINNPDKTFPPVSDFIAFFEKHLYREKDAFTDEAYIRRLEQGRNILPVFYDKRIESWKQKEVITVEKKANTSIGLVPVKGQLDKLEFDGNFVNVVDYKTGSAKNGIKKMKGINNNAEMTEDNYGGDYWRQLAFYHLLINNEKSHEWKTVSAEIEFIEPDNNNDVIVQKLLFTEDELQKVEQLIQNTYKRIMNKEFTKGCEKPECQWCNFNKYYLRGQKLRDFNIVAEEELE